MKKIILCLAAAFVISSSAEACPYQKMAELIQSYFPTKVQSLQKLLHRYLISDLKS